jgi:hypothetical protein
VFSSPNGMSVKKQKNSKKNNINNINSNSSMYGYNMYHHNHPQYINSGPDYSLLNSSHGDALTVLANASATKSKTSNS